MNERAILAIDAHRYFNPEESLEQIREVIQRVPEQLAPLALGVLGSTLRMLGHIPEAHSSIANGLSIAQDMDLSKREGDLLQRASYIVGVEYGSYQDALALAEEALMVHASRGDADCIGKALVDRGIWCLALERFDEAEEIFRGALRLLSTRSRRNLFVAHQGMGLVSMNRQDSAEATIRLQKALGYSDGLGPLLVGKGHWLFGSILAVEERLTDACDAYESAIEQLSADPIDGALVSLEYAQLLLDHQELAKAKAVLVSAARLVNPVFHKSRVAGATMAALVNLAFEGQQLTAELIDQCAEELKRLRQTRRNRSTADPS